ncbi:uncharacterized protein [Physcomitrium patens]|uniref:Uncharacterized protein n=1 Tax=Physcomitrium patens TaxID=3218 RepID=A0A2K1KNT0_PHYPA|nr:uncharacterized protein LOC112281048 [Physcomitrium patens]PNR55444.1 hypothetical protein PHYPA_006341 [Physcomitrium patens]|eukprot:XP_024372970.1 uncharacterized protein LOC112281048 [Physcomitrella patens]
MFATAVLWARKLGPRPIKVQNLGEQVHLASQTLHKILEEHGPITVSECWNHASQMQNHGLKSKRHMKMMLRWMRERRTVKIVVKHGEDGKSTNPNDREFLFSVVQPKVDAMQSKINPGDSSLPAE